MSKANQSNEHASNVKTILVRISLIEFSDTAPSTAPQSPPL
ncbi:MAG: Unknown protein [uncultured Aureispira sp.]|uniref:Uncharacterized protein n=1 Tax=uncultured Aureispira sp. TaxID=1331704 RepID=A0A6S6TF10_9BACT|nr:MAG: Unknown protein [uncultured Aureispira sp.]